ncbi:MAG: nuclear transport factor 2 family protein [Candidatus Cloacimonetes bacterium]|nr:nuclear transport factor 2 family protein [Candidatus Cloacimonadota bacterium]
MKEQHALHRGLEDILEGYWLAYEQKDIEKIMKFLPDEGNILFIGTGRDEKVESIDEFIKAVKRDFEQSEKMEVELKNFNADSAGSVAWTAVDLDAKVTVRGEVLPLFVRFTAVLERISGSWLFRQMHLSFPSSEQQEGESFPVQ